jgi:hypothetical protein
MGMKNNVICRSYIQYIQVSKYESFIYFDSIHHVHAKLFLFWHPNSIDFVAVIVFVLTNNLAMGGFETEIMGLNRKYVRAPSTQFDVLRIFHVKYV